MARKRMKPKMIVNSFYLGEMSAEQAFADFFFQGLQYKRELKSSVDTIGDEEFADYNVGKSKSEVKGAEDYAS
ncbi:MAG: hypothetical protein J6D57_08170 [Mogibacterium sp.]|nr:hypothetical protein [Mogibacterium sp.]